MAKKKQDEKLDALIFIDTNILLDFYRIRSSDISLKYIDEMEKQKDRLILTYQVEMEFKKNRQKVIVESIKEVKKKNEINLSVPAVLADAKALQKLKDAKKEVDTQQKRLKTRIEKILANPNTNDPVFKGLKKLFKHESDYNLNRDKKDRFKIRKLALKRFMLGYPPRKSTDNSIGDAVNWEWIIHCAENTKKDIILVTRDSDFGIIHDSQSYLNDWLKQEFSQRISARRKLILTTRLSEAFKLVDIPVSEEMVNEERDVIRDSYLEYQKSKLAEFIKQWRKIQFPDSEEDE